MGYPKAVRSLGIAVALVLALILFSCTKAQAQEDPQAPPVARSAGTESGIAVFQQHCMGCHGNPNVPKAPAPDVVRQMTAERIYEALTTGIMKPQGDALTEDQRKMLAAFLSGRPLGSAKAGDAKDMPNHCASNPPMSDPMAGPEWDGWSPDITNSRFQNAKAAGLTPEQVPHLKVKWAFGYPTGLSAYSQPTVVSGRVFVGTDIGYVYSINADTGCVYWSYQAKGNVRGAVNVAPIEGHPGTKYAVYFGDAHANIYAVDAQNGKEIWTTRADDHFIARITAAVKVYQGRVYVPVSTSEEYSASDLDYPCCTFRGSLVALDANTGAQIWKSWIVPPSQPSRKNSKGVQQYTSSGGSIWNSPTIDVKRGVIYAGTGDGQSDPVPDTTDSVVAIDMKTGAMVWHYQGEANDAFMGGCNGPTRTDNCPKVNGPDQDIGNSPLLRDLPNGKSVVIFGMKNGKVFALDPDNKGAIVWHTSVAPPLQGQNPFQAALNGIVWGGAADDQNVYYGLQSGGMVAINAATGQFAWRVKFPTTGTARVSNSAAATAMPGVVFVAGSDGMLRGLATSDGHVIWEFDTSKTFETVNKVPAHGGQIASIGPSIVNGMLFVGSGYGVVGNNTGNVLLALAPQ
jgi:polyvinyl alcohol dehydrogenase (cytochrome)